MFIKQSSYLLDGELDVVIRSSITKKINHGIFKFHYIEISNVKSILQHTLFIKIDMNIFDPQLYITVNEFREIVNNLDPKFSQKILDQLKIDRVWIKQGKII